MAMALFSGQRRASSPLDAAEGVLISLLGLDFKVERARGGGASGKVDAGDLFEAQVYGRLVDVNEASLQRVKEARRRLEGTGDALSARVTVEERAALKHNLQKYPLPPQKEGLYFQDSIHTPGSFQAQ